MTSQLRDYNLAIAGLNAPDIDDVGPTGGRDRLGQRLVHAGLISSEQLKRALALQESSGIRLGQALLSLDFIGPRRLGLELARQHRLPFFELTDIPVDPAAAGLLPEELCRRHGLLPLTTSENTVTVAATDPTDIEGIAAARAFLDRDLRLVVSTATDVENALSEIYEERYNDLSTYEFIRRRSPESAYRTMGVMQRAGALITVSLLGVLALFLQLHLLAYIGAALVTLLTLGDAARVAAIIKPAPRIRRLTGGLLDRDLPTMTVLVPLGAGGREVDQALASIARLDYPPAKLDIKLLVPAGSAATRELPFNATIVPVPESDKFLGLVLNYGLVKARGEIITVLSRRGAHHPEEARLAASALIRFDEDEIGMAVAPPPAAGAGSGAFARLRTLGQYCEWSLGSAINAAALAAGAAYFRTNTIRRLGGWDPFDPNPQANFALRLRQAGLSAGLLPTPTRSGRPMAASEVRRNISRYGEARMRLWLVHTRATGPHGVLTTWLLLVPWFQALAWLILPVAAALALLGWLPSWVVTLAVAGLALDLVLNLIVALSLMARSRTLPTPALAVATLPYAALSLAGHLGALCRLILGNPARPWPEAHPRRQAEPAAAPSMSELIAFDAADKAAAGNAS